MPLISVIVPNYNHVLFLEKRLDSIMDQDFTDFEIIILDDASTDASRQIIEKYRNNPKVSHTVFNEINSGSPFNQWKKGIELAQGDWIWVAESDDLADPRFLSTATIAITQNSEIGLFYVDSIIGNENSKEERSFAEIKNKSFQTTKWNKDYIIDGKEEINHFLKYQCTINNASSAVFNRRILNGAWLNDLAQYTYHGDWFCYLLLASVSSVYYSAKPLNFYRQHTRSLTQNNPDIEKSKIDCFRILDFLLGRPFIKEKRNLIAHFTYAFLGTGFRSSGARTHYWNINKGLTIKVLFQTIRNRIFATKPKLISEKINNDDLHRN